MWAFLPTYLGRLADRFGRKPMMILGLTMAAVSLGVTIGPIGGAWLYQTIGPQAPFFANGIVLALCAGVLAVWLRVPTVSLGSHEAGSADSGSAKGG